MAEIVDSVISFKWETHLSFLAVKYTKLLDRGKHLDITLIVEGEAIKVHRLALCASSLYFEVRHESNMFALIFIVLI